MQDEIGFDDIKLNYVTIAAARAMGGLRLVLSAYTIPGPWRESCKCLFDVKGIPYISVRCANAGATETSFGADGSHSELLAWTAQSSAPVAIWADERPRSTWIDQLNLAERLAPEPCLVPLDFDVRVRMFGLINEIAGEHGLGWNKRLFLIDQALKSAAPGSADHTFWSVLAEKYLYTAAMGLAAKARIIEILCKLDAELLRSRERGSRYFVGARLSALDIYSACFYALMEPLPPALCPMASSYRPAYRNADPDIEQAMGSALKDHRDFIYREHLRLPVVF